MNGAARSPLDRVLEAVSALALLAAIADVARHWSVLPERIPVHFGASGTPDGWGSRNMLLELLAMTVVVAVLLTVAEKYQRLINVPLKVDRDSPQVRRLLRSMAIAIKAVIALSFVWVADLTMRTALGEANGLGRAFLPLFLAALAAASIYYLVKLVRLSR